MRRGHRHARPFLRKRQSYGPTDSPAAARHNGYLSFKSVRSAVAQVRIFMSAARIFSSGRAFQMTFLATP